MLLLPPSLLPLACRTVPLATVGIVIHSEPIIWAGDTLMWAGVGLLLGAGTEQECGVSRVQGTERAE